MKKLTDFIERLDTASISEGRVAVIAPLIAYIKEKQERAEEVRLNFICTHNSRRSHLSQVWAQTMANYWGVKNVSCYSGGTEATALFPMVAETLKNTGFKILKLSTENNLVYAIKFAENAQPVIGFSKTWENEFNPKSGFAAVMTCSHADENCPFIPGVEARIAVTYEDPKKFDNTDQQAEKYAERSQQIATEMKYVFSQL